MTAIAGTWDVKLKTPIGSLAVVYTFIDSSIDSGGGSGIDDAIDSGGSSGIDADGSSSIGSGVDSRGVLTGTAAGMGETVALHDIAVGDTSDGERVTWRQSVTKPMRLHLDFDVTVVGDTLSGHSRAGRLPRTQVTGVRRTT